MQFSRIRRRPPAKDFSGPKPFGESLTPQSNLTVVDVVDFLSDWAPSTATLGSSGRGISGVQSRTTGSPASSK